MFCFFLFLFFVVVFLFLQICKLATDDDSQWITAHTIYYVGSKLFWAAAGPDSTNAHTYINRCVCVSGWRKILRLHVPTTNSETDLCSAASIKGYPNKHLLTKMRKTGRAIGPMPRMIITGRILVLGELGVVFTESICFHVTSTFNQTGPIFFSVSF